MSCSQYTGKYFCMDKAFSCLQPKKISTSYQLHKDHCRNLAVFHKQHTLLKTQLVCVPVRPINVNFDICPPPPPYSFSKVQSCKCQYWFTVGHSKSIASSLPEAAACKTGACLREQKAPKQLLKVTLNNITHKRAFKRTQKFYYDNFTITEREVFWGC